MFGLGSYLRYTILWLYPEFGTKMLVIIEALTVHSSNLAWK